MELRIIIVFFFTLLIHLISTLSYSVRLVGAQTGRIAVTIALFNVLALGSRFANSLQAPFLATFVENDVPQLPETKIVQCFIFLLFSASIGTLIGGFLTPTFQRVLTSLVNRFNLGRSIPKLLYFSFNNFGVKLFKKNIRIPSKVNIEHIKEFKRMPRKRILINSLVVALLTVGSFASLYAAALTPDLRLTAYSLAPIITGFATVTLVLYVDPYFSILTDAVINGENSITVFHKSVVWLVISRFLGTLLAILFLWPCAMIIIWVAKILQSL